MASSPLHLVLGITATMVVLWSVGSDGNCVLSPSSQVARSPKEYCEDIEGGFYDNDTCLLLVESEGSGYDYASSVSKCDDYDAENKDWSLVSASISIEQLRKVPGLESSSETFPILFTKEGPLIRGGSDCKIFALYDPDNDEDYQDFIFDTDSDYYDFPCSYEFRRVLCVISFI